MTAQTTPTQISRVSILGGHQSDFARNIAKEGLTVADLVRDTVTETWTTPASSRHRSRASTSATRSDSSTTARVTSVRCRHR